MKTLHKFALTMAGLLCFAILAHAEEKKSTGDEKTLKGTITCAKCDLKLEDATKCQTVIKVSEDGKDVIYYFATDSHKKYHDDTCREAKKGVVKGKVTEKDGKKWVDVTSVEYDKD